MGPIMREIMAIAALEVLCSGSKQKSIPFFDETSHPAELILYGPVASPSVVFSPKIKYYLWVLESRVYYYLH